MLAATGRALKFCAAFGSCVAIAVCGVYITKSSAQGAKERARRGPIRSLLRATPPQSTASPFRMDTAIGS